MKIGKICYEFDNVLLTPLKMEFLGINEDTDGWMRFKYIDKGAYNRDYTAWPQSYLGKSVFLSSDECLSYIIDKLASQLSTNKNKDDARRKLVPEWVSMEIWETWKTARDAGNQQEAFVILERMVDRLSFGRLVNNPSLANK
jgi:hypothetical protein